MIKQISIAALLFMFTVTAVAAPEYAFAKKGGDDDSDRYEYSDDYDDDEDEDDDRDEDDDSDSRRELEVEADVYTDTTIVKVELSDRKTVFTTTADTRSEVVAAVVERFELTTSEVEAVLEFEVEDRASRASDRAKITGQNNRPAAKCYTTDSRSLEVEADVFTNTTIVKVERGATKLVFETSATTSDAVVTAVLGKVTDLTRNQVEAVIDFEVEDRVSRPSDFTISSDDTDDCKRGALVKNEQVKNTTDTELKARIDELQKLVETLIKLLTARIGSSI